jgi:hypothetical protein
MARAMSMTITTPGEMSASWPGPNVVEVQPNAMTSVYTEHPIDLRVNPIHVRGNH